MSLLKPATPTNRLFAGFFGEEGSGKTFTSTALACYARHRFGLEGPIAALDTEQGMGFRAPYVKEKTGKDLLLCETRDIDKVEPFLRECAKEGVSVAIIDSITHIIKTLRNRYFDAHNIVEPEASQYPAADRPFNDLLDKMLTARMNIIICGREGSKWGRYKNTKGKMVNGPVGWKMDAGKAGYEPDLLFHMRVSEKKGGGVDRWIDVKKDRSNKLDGNITIPFDMTVRLAPFFDFLLDTGKEVE